MARLAPRSQLPRRLLMEKRAWPERLWLLIPGCSRPLLAPGGDGIAQQQTPCMQPLRVTPAPAMLTWTEVLSFAGAQKPDPDLPFSKKTRFSHEPPSHGSTSITLCHCLHPHYAWVLCWPQHKRCPCQRNAVSISAMTAVTPSCFQCWSSLHLPHVFPGGARAATLSWLCHSLLQQCQGSGKVMGREHR